MWHDNAFSFALVDTLGEVITVGGFLRQPVIVFWHHLCYLHADKMRLRLKRLFSRRTSSCIY